MKQINEIIKIIEDEFKELVKGVKDPSLVYVYKQQIKRKIKELHK